MPSEDRVDPKANAWMEDRSDGSRPTAPTKPGSSQPSGKDRASARQAGIIQRLALATGRDPNELAEAIPEDTLRRLKFPVTTQVADDGSLTFKEPNIVIEGGRKALLAVDRAEGGGVKAGQPRDEATGRFIK